MIGDVITNPTSKGILALFIVSEKSHNMKVFIKGIQTADNQHRSKRRARSITYL